jgi:hypothetical protein
MKHLNHMGSSVLLALVVALFILLLLPLLGWPIEWTPKTTPYRLVNSPFIGWGLVVILSAGLWLVRKGPAIAQCVSALMLVGLVFGLALVSGLFWDAFLSPVLVFSVLPIQAAAIARLRVLVPPQADTPASAVAASTH